MARLETLVAQRGIEEVARIDLNHTIETGVYQPQHHQDQRHPLHLSHQHLQWHIRSELTYLRIHTSLEHNPDLQIGGIPHPRANIAEICQLPAAKTNPAADTETAHKADTVVVLKVDIETDLAPILDILHHVIPNTHQSRIQDLSLVPDLPIPSESQAQDQKPLLSQLTVKITLLSRRKTNRGPNHLFIRQTSTQ